MRERERERERERDHALLDKGYNMQEEDGQNSTSGARGDIEIFFNVGYTNRIFLKFGEIIAKIIFFFFFFEHCGLVLQS
jgi:hypothetical protein